MWVRAFFDPSQSTIITTNGRRISETGARHHKIDVLNHLTNMRYSSEFVQRINEAKEALMARSNGDDGIDSLINNNWGINLLFSSRCLGSSSSCVRLQYEFQQRGKLTSTKPHSLETDDTKFSIRCHVSPKLSGDASGLSRKSSLRLSEGDLETIFKGKVDLSSREFLERLSGVAQADTKNPAIKRKITCALEALVS